MRCTDGTVHNILANEMTVDIDMFCPHVEGIVAGDESGRFVIAVHLHR